MVYQFVWIGGRNCDFSRISCILKVNQVEIVMFVLMSQLTKNHSVILLYDISGFFMVYLCVYGIIVQL